MRSIIISAVFLALMVMPSLSQNNSQPAQPPAQPEQAPSLLPKIQGAQPMPVQVPMMCGDYASITKLLKEWNFEDIMISRNPMTEGKTFIMFHFDIKGNKLAISTWLDDMSNGCIAYIGDNVSVNHRGIRKIDPSI